MATVPPILSLNIGSQSLGLAGFEAQPGGGLILSGYQLRELTSDPAAEPDRNRQLREVLPMMMDQIGIRPGPVQYAVSGQAVFARFVKLPVVDQEKIDRIIAFEAEQNVPFPLSEVVWDYQIVGSEASDKIEVVLVAIKADLLEAINLAVEEAGLQTTLVDIAPMALFNAFRYNYREPGACSLVIDIGARTTNLLFIEPGKVFSRSIPIGGSSITSAIAKEFNQPYADAELRKKQDGFVSLGNAHGASNQEVARISKLVRSTMTRLHAEVARSISFYRTQQQGSQPERVFLCGGTVSTPFIREFFHEKLQRPVEFLNPLRNVTVARSLALKEVSQSAHLLGELVGLALRRTMTCPMALNLRPASVVRRQRLAQRQPFFVIAGTCFILGLLAWGFYFARIAHIQSDVATMLQREVSEMQGYERQLAQLRRELDSLDGAASPLLGLVSDQGAWLRILDDLNARLPKQDIWITELAPTSGEKIIGQTANPGPAAAIKPTPPPRGRPARASNLPMIDGVFVRGLYLFNPKQQEIVVDYFRNLLGSTIFEVDANRQSEVIKPSTPTTTEWAYPYELRLKLRQSFPLQ
jgi:type IV pilus assembly protein PilM